jgi:DNA-binding NtrC family response regulator
MNQADSNDVAGGPVTIFIVDDEPMLLELAAAFLEPLGYDVRTFSNPETALAEFPAAKPAVIVTDFAMGKVSGLDLIRECRRLDPLQKTMLLSGTVDQNIYTDSSTKPDVFLVKPYQISDLIESVRKLAAR